LKESKFDTLDKMMLLTPVLLPLRSKIEEALKQPVDELVSVVRMYNSAICLDIA
jgi:hypothetical protein